MAKAWNERDIFSSREVIFDLRDSLGSKPPSTVDLPGVEIIEIGLGSIRKRPKAFVSHEYVAD